VEARQFPEALTECDLVLRNAPSPSVAARASLLAAYCRGQIWSASRQPADRQSYQSALTEHLNRFAADETSGDAAWMLGSLAEQAGDWSAVVDADRRIPPAHPRAEESLARSVRAAKSALDEIHAAGGKTSGNKTPEQWSAEAQLLASRLLKPGGRDLLAARRILAAATLLAAMPQPDFSRILNLLDQIPSPPPETDAEKWQQLGQEAAALRLVCLTSTGQFADAAATLEQLRSISLTELLTVLRKLSDSGRQLGGPARAELGQLEIKTIQRIRLQGAALSPSEQQLLLECEAEALFATGQYDEAARMFGQAAIAKPDLMPRVAESLTLTGKKDDLQRARGLWQQIAAKEKQGTRPWFEARLKLARVLLALGQKNDCRQLIATTRIIYEDLGGPDLKQAFDTLEQETAGP
ncbi:MAG TPA: hypothetical protein VM510_09715, partial [Caulifigura sp.]|nr:hypothetical protein [Caulifigura sp.]